MTLLGETSLTVTRQAGGSYVQGVWTDGGGGPTTFSITVSVQPVTPRLIDMLPEGSRTDARFVFYAEIGQPEIYTVDLGGQVRADRVEYNGREYMVQSVGDWSAHVSGLPYREYVLLEIGEDEV
jgi:hypothetical protein